jgi:hypothetical protein
MLLDAIISVVSLLPNGGNACFIAYQTAVRA